MAEKLKKYRCELCGNIIEVLQAGDGDLVCCGKPMVVMVEKTLAEEGNEKHVPVIEKTANGIKVKVGSVGHPMEEQHYIEWIEIVADGRIYREFLKPGDSPEAVFEIDADSVHAREYCSIHGLWKN
jgi:superoxide reductase